MEIDFTHDDPGLLGQIDFSHAAVEKLFADSGIAGQITGPIHVGGTVSKPLLDGALRIKNGNYKNLEIKDGKSEFSYYKNSVNVSSLEAHAAEACKDNNSPFIYIPSAISDPLTVPAIALSTGS